jgi:hypothetical protein
VNINISFYGRLPQSQNKLLFGPAEQALGPFLPQFGDLFASPAQYLVRIHQMNSLFFIFRVHPQRVTIFAKAESSCLPLSAKQKFTPLNMLPPAARRTIAYDNPAAGQPPELPPATFGPY